MMSPRCLESSYSRLVLGLAVGVLLWGMMIPIASAQQARTLNIQDGTVYIDGQPLSEDQLPDSLDLEGIRAQYRFVGIQRPVVELKGRLFAVEEGLTPVTEAEVRRERGAVVLRSGPSRARSSRTASAARQVGGERTVPPEANHQQYLDAVQQSSRELYERLLHERRMEEDAEDLARTIRLLPRGSERQAKIDTLRAMLEDIFEIKQENRRREVERLQRQIRELQQNLRKREQMRDRMIDRRLGQLIDSARDR
jgi:hypothetical protein